MNLHNRGRPWRSLSELLAFRAGHSPDSPAILGVGREPLSYGALAGLVSQAASRLSGLGIGRQDRVALVLENGPEMATAFLSVSCCAVCAPLNPSYRKEEFDFYLSDLRAKALLVEAGSASAAAGAAGARGIPVFELYPARSGPAGQFSVGGSEALLPSPACEDDVALVLHTSGTTSRPKIVPLTHGNLLASAGNVARSLALTEADRCLNVMPLFHIHGLVAALLASLWAGGSVVCAPGFHAPRFLDWMQESGATWYTAVPAVHQAVLLQAERDPAGARRCRPRFIRSCSAPLAPQVMAELERVFQAPVIEAYGMTEAAHQMTANPLPPRERKPGTVGVASGPEVAVMDEAGNLLAAGRVGEVVVRGPNVTAGYENNPGANSASFVHGWFRTGDQGVMDQDGYLRLTGRLKEIINRGGEKISPREIDEVLLDHPGVAQAVAFAVPDPRLGEEVGAAVVLRPGRTATARDIQEFAAARLADFKVPRMIVLVDEIPKGPTGKPQRIGLAERLGVGRLAGARPEAHTRFEPPRSRVEKFLAATWAEVLGLERAGIHDDFFQLGGDSMLAAQVLSRIRDKYGVPVSIIAFYDSPTIQKLAALIEQAGDKRRRPHLAPIREGGGRPPLFCMHGNDGDALIYRELGLHLSGGQPVYGLESPLLAGTDLPAPSLEQLAALYLEAIRSVQPQGPYSLAGTCLGAYIAFEMACRLQREGETVGLLAVMNTDGSWRMVRSFLGGLRYHAAQLAKMPGSARLRYAGDRVRYRLGRTAELAAERLDRVLRRADVHVPDWVERRRIRASHVRASQAYTPGIFRGKLVYFQGSQDAWRDFRPFWGQVVDGPIDCVVVPGTQAGVLREPNVRVLARELQARLDAVATPLSAAI